MVHGKKILQPHNPPTPLRGGFVFVFPIVFRPFFPKVGKQSQPYELVSILTSTIYVLSSRARIMREKHPLSTRNLMFKDEKFNVVLSLKYEKFNVVCEKQLY